MYQNYYPKKKQLYKKGVLLVQVGSPNSTQFKDIKKYLREFLSDKRIIEMNPFIWKIILYLCILPFRSLRSKKWYKEAWSNKKTTLKDFTHNLSHKLNERNNQKNIYFYHAMRYQNPAIKDVLQKMAKNNIQEIIVLPLFPQYSSTTSGSIFVEITKELSNWRNIPKLIFINNYFTNELYIEFMAKKIVKTQSTWDKLLFSFHGLPQKYIDAGDYYQEQCFKTVDLITKKLNLSETKYTTVFQSSFGYIKWTKPSLSNYLLNCKNENIAIIAPSFSLDCLETFYEIDIENRKLFKNQHPHNSFIYIDCLNDSEEQLKIIENIVLNYF